MSDKNPYKKGGLFEGASFLLFEKAKQLRKKMTKAEEILWMYLREGINGCKLRRQHPISNYVVDFFCFKAKLIIEIDGSIHNRLESKEMDKIRQVDIERLGYTIIRFSNSEVYNQLEMVLNKIGETVNNIINSKAPNNGV